jgi:hypothetical protein
MKASELFVKCLENEGVEYIFEMDDHYLPARGRNGGEFTHPRSLL